MNEQLLMQIQQLASNTGSNRTNHLSNHLASIHTQMLKQELVSYLFIIIQFSYYISQLRRQEKLRQDREEAEKQRQQAAIEQFRQQQALEQARRAQQNKQTQSSQEATLLRNVLAIQRKLN